MKRLVLSLSLAFILCIQISAQTYNSVFPIVNTVSDRPEFVAANVYMTQEYMGKTIYIADEIGLYDSNGLFRELESNVYGPFLSFTYVTKAKAATNGAWNTGAETTQMAYHPGGLHNFMYKANTMKDEPNYAFCFSEDNGLVLYDLNTLSKVALLDEGGDIKQYSSLTVFAGSDYTMEDFIVIVGQQKFKIFGTISGGSNGVKLIYSSQSAPSFFDINGNKLNAPQRGINIVVDGETSKKVMVK